MSRSPRPARSWSASGSTTWPEPAAGLFALAADIGSLTASRLGSRVPADRLRRSFAFLVFAVAAFVVVHVVLNPDASV